MLKKGKYQEQVRSLNLPLLELAAVSRFLKPRETLHETACIRAFRQWVVETFPSQSA